MTKQQYRTKIQIVNDILSAISSAGQEGLLISVLVRRANVSHDIIIEKCNELINADLLETKIYGRRRVFRITSKGMLFYKELQKFQTMLESNNILA